ncbi:MAG TPA: hypothetical protein PLV45_19560, partial [bacterium]|nr:hypothetical protein [bacterium]
MENNQVTNGTTGKGVKTREITVEDIPDLFRVRIATWHTPNGREDMARLGITPATVRAMLDAGT